MLFHLHIKKHVDTLECKIIFRHLWMTCYLSQNRWFQWQEATHEHTVKVRKHSLIYMACYWLTVSKLLKLYSLLFGDNEDPMLLKRHIQVWQFNKKAWKIPTLFQDRVTAFICLWQNAFYEKICSKALVVWGNRPGLWRSGSQHTRPSHAIISTSLSQSLGLKVTAIFEAFYCQKYKQHQQLTKTVVILGFPYEFHHQEGHV